MISTVIGAPAPAKLNLFLHVTGRRSDGYHELETVFDLIDLSDRLDFWLRDDGRIEHHHPTPGVGRPQDDLALRAALALAEAAGRPVPGASLRVHKRIPMGAGLGGGSSDAATTLLVLNRMWGLHWRPARLAALGRGLGADVPVFIHGHPAYATGIGERLTPLALPLRHYLLVTPQVQVPTGRIFTDPELTRDTKPLKIDGLSWGPSVFRGRNDLEPVTLRLFPEVARALASLRQAARPDEIESGADARMSGSGACVFLPAANRQAAQAMQARWARDAEPGSGSSRVTASLARHPLHDWAFART